MANLTDTVRWVQYVPDLLGNRALERPFYFELNGSMSKEQMKATEVALTTPGPASELSDDAPPEAVAARNEASRAEAVTRYAKALEPYVRFGAEPLTVGGQPVTTLAGYFDFATSKLTGLAAFLEPGRALVEVNTLDSRASFFSGRLSGGFTSTTRPNGASGRSQTAAR
jgi:hypothetical protein